ncbi:hypothetical protein COOONC_14521 [Cooperia oncophora]
MSKSIEIAQIVSARHSSSRRRTKGSGYSTCWTQWVKYHQESQAETISGSDHGILAGKSMSLKTIKGKELAAVMLKDTVVMGLQPKMEWPILYGTFGSLRAEQSIESSSSKWTSRLSLLPQGKFEYFLTFTLIMMVFGTLYDLFIHQPELDVLPASERRTNHLFIRIILSYSVYTNGLEILRTSKKDGEVNCLHGVRFLSMCWIILGHTYYYIATSLTLGNWKPLFSQLKILNKTSI